MPGYDLFPEVTYKGQAEAHEGYHRIVEAIKNKINLVENNQYIVAIDCYPGVRNKEIFQGIVQGLNPTLHIQSDDLAYCGEKITEIIKQNLTDDRVFGVLSHHEMKAFFCNEKLSKAKMSIQESIGLIVIYGVGASLVVEPDLLIYADIPRWEIQLRYRSKEIGNWKMNNHDEEILRKYKRGYFVEWRIADRHKKTLFAKIDYLLDTTIKENPKMIDGNSYRNALSNIVKQPFRLVPYFDAGVWGGQWMKEKFKLSENGGNYAWAFDGVPEENSLFINFSGVRVEIPSINVVFTHPLELLGSKVYARFGEEFPIRFDFLDTMKGQNLSLQVHPLTSYIQEKFGMHYTQDESYYIMDAAEDSTMYLGLKNDINPEEFIKDLKKAQEGGYVFPDKNYINCFTPKKHDHYLIPAGTVHCGGKNMVVLEISATPYIFTFKLWDWGRVGLDGVPRPVHIEHGEKNIQYQWNGDWVNKKLINQFEIINEQEGYLAEKTGLHEREFIETIRHWTVKKVNINTHKSVNMLNLIEGDEAIVESPTNKFEPFVVHYAETFIIPANIETFSIRPYGKSIDQRIGVIQAYIR
jgi:mannose-6-phosphate isomerase class I